MSKKWKKPGPIKPAPALRAGIPPLSVPIFSRLDEYLGAWAMEPRAATALWEKARTINLQAHVAQNTENPPPLRAAFEKQPAKNGKSIAVIKVMGTLMKQQNSMDASTSTVQLRRDIRAAVADPEVSAILLAIDSPGGTVAGTDDLAAEVRAARKSKPVYAQIEDLGASAAYWIASQAELVFANSPTALVGSIGTVMTVYDLADRAEQKGVKALVFATGPLKGAGIEGTAITEEQAAYFQGIVDSAQISFDAAVKKGRNLTDKQLASVRTGGVFSAEAALENKLLDGIQSLETTLAQLIKAGAQNQTTKRGAQTPVPIREASMEFHDWLRAQSFEPETLSETQLANLRAIFDAGPPLARAPEPPPVRNPAEEAAAAVQARRQAEAAEVERLAGIRRVCAEAGNPSLRADDGSQVPVEAHAIAQGWDVERAQMAAQLEQLRTSRPSGPALIHRGHDRDCTLEALQGAMILRAGGSLDHPAYTGPQAIAMKLPPWIRAGLNSDQRQRAMEAAHRYSDMSMVDLCREAVRLDGRDVPTGRHDLIQAAFSGGTLTSIFTTNVNTIVLATYTEAEDTSQAWTKTTDVADFKTNERPRMTKGPNLKKLPRGAEADHISRSDAGESYKIARYAKQFTVDEQDIIDDAFNALNDMPVEMGNASARLRPDLVYAILLANPTLATTARQLFNATDGNLNTTAALAAATLKAAITDMGLFTENGINLNLKPTHLLVPPTLSFTARELLQSTGIFLRGTTDTERGNKNTLEGLMDPIAEARLENGVTDPATDTVYSGSSSTWFLACAIAHTIEVAYLRGTGRAPQIRSFILTEGKWGIGWDCAMDIGAKELDWKGLHKNTA